MFSFFLLLETKHSEIVLNKIISFSLHNRPVILFFSVLLMVVGI